MDPVTGLAGGRIAVGAVALLAPRLAARLFLLDAGSAQLPYWSRLFGSREIALGALTLASQGEARRRLVQVGVAIDAADAFTGFSAASSGGVSKKAGFVLAAVALGAVVQGAQGLVSS